jgi:general stress protein 26
VTRTELVDLLRRFSLAVVASVHEGAPQAAVVGIAVGDDLELVFDTLTSSRKFRNLTREPRVALVMTEGELTVQLEGHADVPGGDDLARMQAIYYAADPDGRERALWPDITWIRVRPTWLRVSDYSESPPVIEEHHL